MKLDHGLKCCILVFEIKKKKKWETNRFLGIKKFKMLTNFVEMNIGEQGNLFTLWRMLKINVLLSIFKFSNKKWPTFMKKFKILTCQTERWRSGYHQNRIIFLEDVWNKRNVKFSKYPCIKRNVHFQQLRFSKLFYIIYKLEKL